MAKKNKREQLDKKGQETLNALMSTPTITAAAKKLDIKRNTLYARIEKYKLNEIQKELGESTMRKLMIAANKSADVMIEGLEDRRARYDIAKDVLDRVVGNKSQNTTNVQVNLMQKLEGDVEKYGE